MTTPQSQVVAFRKFAAFVVEWDPTQHGGEREPWESMEARLDATWAAKLAANDCQQTMDPAITERRTDPETDCRRVVRWAWTLPLSVPSEIASRVLHGVLQYTAP